MSDKIVLKVQEITQPIGKLYVSSINAYTLFKMSESNIIQLSENKDSYDGVQREIRADKVNHIKDYLTSVDATLPNSIILNVTRDKIIERQGDSITLMNTKDTFTIIDGQHRLKGFEDGMFNDFETGITFFIDLPDEDQSRVFVTINSEQTKVDPSMSFYQEINDRIFTPRKMVIELSIMFSKDLNSPWRKKIKLLGKKDELSEDATISLKAFSKRILNYIYNDDKDFHRLRNCLKNNDNDLEKLLSEDPFNKSFLWEFYITHDEQSLYKILLNYFNAMKKVFKHDWTNDFGLLTKTTGYDAIMDLFEDVFSEGMEKGVLDEEFFYNKLSPLKQLDGTIDSSNYGTSGYKASGDLYKVFRQTIYDQVLVK